LRYQTEFGNERNYLFSV